MNCREVTEQLSQHALGELDAEPRRALERHLEGCAGCRVESDRMNRGLASLRNVPPVETAESRRERVVAAMAREHADRVQGFLLRPRRRRRVLVAGMAAALLAVAAVGVWVVWKPSEFTLTVVEVHGRAQVLVNGAWRPIESGMRLDRGDRIVTENGSTVRAELSRMGTIWIDQNSTVALGAERTLDLERGALYGELSDAIRVRTVTNDLLTVRAGKFEAGLRDTFALVLGVSYKRPIRSEGADLVFENRPFGEVAEQVSKISGVRIRSAHERVAQYRIWFYGVSVRGPDLIGDLEAAVRDQGMTLRDENGIRVAHLVVPAEKREAAQRLFARIVDGEASLRSYGGALHLLAGEEGAVSSSGTPIKERLASPEVPWTRPGFYSSGAGRTLPLPGKIAFRIVGYDERQRPLVECTLEGAEMLTTLDGDAVTVIVSDATSMGNDEIVVPLRVRIERKR